LRKAVGKGYLDNFNEAFRSCTTKKSLANGNWDLVLLNQKEILAIWNIYENNNVLASSK
jgi:hypothetical protein